MQIERGGSPRPIDDFITDSPDGLNWVKIGDAPAQGNYITKTAEKIKPEGLSKTREVHPGDLILSNSMSFGKPYIMGIDGCIHDGWLLIRNTYKVFDLTFLCHLLGTPQMIIQYKSLAAGSTVNNLNKELVGNTVVTIPTIKEQRVLGQYLETLDNLITLHQREFAFLCKEKSKKFRYIKNAWEQRKLGDTNTFFTDGNYGEAYPKASDMTDSSTGIPFLTGGNLKNGRLDLSGANYITYEKHMKLTSGHLAEDDIVIAVRGSLGALGYVNKGNSGWNINSQLAILRTDKTVLIGKYLIQFLLSTTGQKELLSKQTGSALKQLPISSLKDIAIPVTSIEEQERIGMYLQNLDHLITLHQRKPNFYTGGYYAE